MRRNINEIMYISEFISTSIFSKGISLTFDVLYHCSSLYRKPGWNCSTTLSTWWRPTDTLPDLTPTLAIALSFTLRKVILLRSRPGPELTSSSMETLMNITPPSVELFCHLLFTAKVYTSPRVSPFECP
jgi:hypothetical protein